MIRKYGTDFYKVAGIIAAEVVEHGASTGWSGTDYSFFMRLKEYLSQFNIVYVDDFSGEWQYEDPID